MSSLNTRFAAILVVSVVVLAGAVAVLHRYQVYRHADSYLGLADKAIEEAEDAKEADSEQTESKAENSAKCPTCGSDIPAGSAECPICSARIQ